LNLFVNELAKNFYNLKHFNILIFVYFLPIKWKFVLNQLLNFFLFFCFAFAWLAKFVWLMSTIRCFSCCLKINLSIEILLFLCFLLLVFVVVWINPSRNAVIVKKLLDIFQELVFSDWNIVQLVRVWSLHFIKLLQNHLKLRVLQVWLCWISMFDSEIKVIRVYLSEDDIFNTELHLVDKLFDFFDHHLFIFCFWFARIPFVFWLSLQGWKEMLKCWDTCDLGWKVYFLLWFDRGPDNLKINNFISFKISKKLPWLFIIFKLFRKFNLIFQTLWANM